MHDAAAHDDRSLSAKLEKNRQVAHDYPARERIMRDALAELDVVIERGVTLTSFAQSAEGVDVGVLGVDEAGLGWPN